MNQITIQINAEQEKVNAIRIYLKGKGTDLETELSDYVDTLYKRYVPLQVRDYIEKADVIENGANAKSPARVPRKKPLLSDFTDEGTDTQAVCQNASLGQI